MSRKPIQLGRVFYELKEGDDDQAGDDALGSLASFRLVKGHAWDQLLSCRCVVVLGEAGTGKTTEFRQRCELLATSNAAAFFLTVEDLATEGLAGSLGSVSHWRLTGWMASAERGYFFLDAVDEARLNGKRFTTALRKLERELETSISRATILISCRVSDWRAYSDRNEILATLYPVTNEAAAAATAATPSSTAATADAPSLSIAADLSEANASANDDVADGFDDVDPDDHGWRDPRDEPAKPTVSEQARPAVAVYALAPLNEAQVELLAASLGVAEPKAFSEAAKRAAAHAYLERPRDVEWLVGYWLRHDAIGSLTELVENDVQEKLLERNPDRKPDFSAAKAQRAAEVLAGISALERRTTFLLPDGELDAERVAQSVDPNVWLPEFTKQEIGELLTLPLFDEATYGRVRIHHRTVAEYLAAQWLASLLQKGLAPIEVDAILFRRGPDGLVVPKELVAVAAWLAGSNEHIRRRLLEVSPLVLLEGGDPNSLPEDSRRDLLSALAQQYVTRRRLFKSFDHAALGRLASGGLADTINSLLRTSTEDELLDTLLTIVSEGAMTGCAEETLRLASDEATPRHARLEAIRTLAKVGIPAQWESLLRVVVEEAGEIDHEVGGALVGAMHPRAMSTTRLLVLLSRVKPPPKRTGTVLPYFVGHNVYGDTAEAERAPLLGGLLDLVRVPHEPRAVQRIWLVEPLARLASSYAADQGDARNLEPVIRFFAEVEGAGRLDSEYGGDEIRKLTDSRSDLRRLMFWAHVSVVVATSKRAPTRFLDLVRAERLWELRDEDRDWLETDARTRPTVQERLLAFDCLVAAPTRDDQIEVLNERIRRLVEVDADLAKRYRRYGTPLAERPVTKWQRQHRVREARQKGDLEADLRWLHEHLAAIESGEDERTLTILASQAHLDPQEPGRGVEKLRTRYDGRVAVAAREGWRRSWRRVLCLLPHEEERRNTFSFSMIAGFAGLTIDVERGLDFSSLTADEGRRAARYATRGVNRFPAWTDELVAKQPAAIAEIFGESIAADYAVAADGPETHNVLHLLSHASGAVRELCGPTVVELLEAGEPPREDALERCIEALLATPSTHTDLARVAAARCLAFVPSRCAESIRNRPRLVLWWCAWFAVEASSALSDLASTIARDPSGADELILAVCDRLWRLGNDARIALPFPNTGKLLARLLEIVLSHVRPQDDIQHDGMFSPGARDHSESLRRYLLDQLVGTPGEETYLGLRRIAQNPALASWRDYLMSLADQRLTQDAGAREADVSERIVRAYKQHGLAAPDHFEEAGLRTMATANVDFGIVTALPEERDAVLAQLSRLTTVEKLDKDGIDTHTYYQATLQTTRKERDVYRVVVVCCPSMGPQIAVATTGALLTRWKPRHVLLVGIALGLKGETKHGDVMLAEQVADYSLGKKETGKKRQHRWRAHLAGASLFESAQQLDTTWSRSILIARPEAGSPDVLPGIVASGGDVVADDELIAEFLETWPKLIGIEMEAGGTATAVHDSVNKPEFLMIKGVSDHGKDKHDPDVVPWRAYACGSAAAFAVELMRAGPAPAVTRGEETRR